MPAWCGSCFWMDGVIVQMEHWCLLTVIIHSFSFIHSFVCLFVRSFICKCNLFTHGVLAFIKNSLKRVRAFQIELGFGAKKTGVPGEKPLGSRERTNNKLTPHMAATPGFEPGPHWWEASGLTTAPPFLPLIHSFIHLFGLHFTSYILLSIDRTKNEKTGVFLGAVSWCCGNHCWFAFVLWCGYCSVSFQSFVLRHLVITPETDKTCRRHDEHRPLDCVKSSIS